MKNYGKILKELREDKGISLSSLAKSAQLSKSTLSRFENGETQIGIRLPAKQNMVQ